MSELKVNKAASQYVKLFGGNKTGNPNFWLPLVVKTATENAVSV